MNFKKFLQQLSNNKEVSLVLLIITMIITMIVPISHVMMDSLIALNMGITMTVLMVVIYMNSPLDLTSFPSILLLLALIRIGITISSSRLILLDGSAGHIVDTFGQFVVGGNLMVGIVIFVIVTIINFIVITKGSERVAEVTARFTLDAMPGKQMSIDADLRSGNIDTEVAQEQRRQLALESKLYGAMDGAMKFVKGDSIASIIDILINLLGGLVIGVVQRDMDFSQAMHTYTILTIGDGLVQQIPALMISLTAGMMITRVSDGKETNNLGQNILKQIFNSYKALFSTAFMLFAFSFIPGMPKAVLFPFCTALIIGGVVLIKFNKKNRIDPTSGAPIEEKKAFVEQAESDVAFETSLQKLSPLILYLPPNIKNSRHLNDIKNMLKELQQEIMLDLGIIVPQVIIRFPRHLTDNHYEIVLYEIPASSGIMYWDHILVTAPDEYLVVLDDTDSFPNEENYGMQKLGHWYHESNISSCEDHDIAYITMSQFLCMRFKSTIRLYLPDFLGIQEVKDMFDHLHEYKELIGELLRMIPLNKITDILQRLIAEGISIRNFKLILDTMLEWAQKEKETIIITEYVRKALGRYIAYKFSNGTYVMPAVMLAGQVEDIIRDSIRYADSGSYLSMDPEISSQIVNSVKSIVDAFVGTKEPVIITQLDIRRYLRTITEKELPHLSVLSFQELSSYVTFDCIGVIEI